MRRQRVDAIEQWHDVDLVRQREIAAARIGRALDEGDEFLEAARLGSTGRRP